MCAVEFVEDQATKKPFLATEKIGLQIHKKALEKGLLSRIKGDSYLLAPPIVITESELDRIVEILSESIKDILG